MTRGSVRARVAIGSVVLGLVVSPLSGLAASTTPAEAAENKDVAVTSIPLAGTPWDVVVDKGGRLAYVSLRDSDRIAVVDLVAGSVITSLAVDNPVGLSLSKDGAHLYVARYDATGIERIDLSDGTRRFVELDELGDHRTWDVAEVRDDLVLVTANPSSNGLSWVVAYDFETGTEWRVANDRIVSAGPKIYVSGDNAYIGESFNPPSLYKLDLTDDSMPVVESDNHGDVDGTQEIAVSPDGSFIITRTGQKLRASDLEVVGTVARGVPVISADNSTVFSLNGRSPSGFQVSVTDAATMRFAEEWDAACGVSDYSYPPFLMVAGAGSDLVAIGHDELCVIHNDQLTLKPAPPGGRFFDDDGNIHEVAIESIAAEGITTGCNPPLSTSFCPGDSVTRGQMAAFLVRALGLPTAVNTFVDDNDSVFEADIGKLAAAGITKGCNPPANTMFCPNAPVTRGQMAAFLTRAMGYTTPEGADGFADDDGSVFETSIDALAAAGITKGCNPPANTMFCPGQHVTRAQMATFLARALDLEPRPLPARPPTTEGDDLEVITTAQRFNCTGEHGELCTVYRTVDGEFFLATGWFVDEWSSRSATERAEFASTGVRLEAEFNGSPINLVDWGLRVVDDVADKTYSFQFPDWLSGDHVLTIRFIDEPKDYVWTIDYRLDARGAGYLHLEPANATPNPMGPPALLERSADSR